MKRLIYITFLAIILSTQISFAQNNIIPVNIGTGDNKSGLYPIGISIAKILNINSKIHKLAPNVIATEGDIYNIDNIINGDLMLGVVSADVEYRAYKGLGEWEGSPQYDLRSIIGITPEYMQLIVREASKIKTIMDLKGKNINLGLIGEGTYLNSQKILNSYGFDNYTVNYDNTSTSIQDIVVRMQDGRLDGFFITSIVPLNTIKLLTETTPVRLIDITGVNKLFLQYPKYKITVQSKSVYPRAHNPNNIKTISVMTTLVTSSKTSNYTAYILAKEIVENIHILRKLHPALKNLTLKEMINSNAAPIHPGAMRYYLDKGLIN